MYKPCILTISYKLQFNSNNKQINQNNEYNKTACFNQSTLASTM